MSTQSTAVVTLANLVSRALHSATDEERRSGVDMNGLTLEFIDAAVGGLCLLVSGEGAARKAEIETLAAHWTSLYGGAVRVGTDIYEDYEGGQYTCLWLNMETAIDGLAA